MSNPINVISPITRKSTVLRSSKYAGSRLRVFYSGGPNTLAYAEGLRQLCAESWKTNVVSVVPVGDERIIDVQITVGNKGQEVEARTLLDALRSAGIKHKKFSRSIRYYCNFAFSPLASFRMLMSGSSGREGRHAAIGHGTVGRHASRPCSDLYEDR
jgi:hypothetical protein